MVFEAEFLPGFVSGSGAHTHPVVVTFSRSHHLAAVDGHFCQGWAGGAAGSEGRVGLLNVIADEAVVFVNCHSTMNTLAMIEITSTELRRNFGKYLDMATKKQEQVLVRYRNKSLFTLTLEPISESLSEKEEKNDTYFEQTEVRDSILRGRADVKAGRTRKFTGVKDLWANIT